MALVKKKLKIVGKATKTGVLTKPVVPLEETQQPRLNLIKTIIVRRCPACTEDRDLFERDDLLVFAMLTMFVHNGIVADCIKCIKCGHKEVKRDAEEERNNS